LADLRRACELSHSARDYSYFQIWLVRTKSGERENATAELQAYLDNREPQKGREWPLKIGLFLAGRMTEDDLLKAADDANKRTDVNQHCEAFFYAGSKRLIDGDRIAARDYFKKCLATNVRDYTEFSSAEAELKFLEK
jgi:lipoprotein NlpI